MTPITTSTTHRIPPGLGHLTLPAGQAILTTPHLLHLATSTLGEAGFTDPNPAYTPRALSLHTGHPRVPKKIAFIRRIAMLADDIAALEIEPIHTIPPIPIADSAQYAAPGQSHLVIHADSEATTLTPLGTRGNLLYYRPATFPQTAPTLGQAVLLQDLHHDRLAGFITRIEPDYIQATRCPAHR